MDEDQRAIMDCQLGKNESYRFLVEKYKLRAYQLALLYTGNRDDALDLSQEAFCRAFRSIKSFKTGKNFYCWLYEIIKNICINHQQRHSKDQRLETDVGQELSEDQLPAVPRPDEIFEEHEMRELLWTALARLKPADREIIMLKEFNELTYEQIAAVLKIPAGSVMSRLYYARQRLAGLMGREYE